MEKFSITTNLSPNEYAKVMLVGLYKKPGFILASILGLYFLGTIILDHFKVIDYYSSTPYFELFCGLFCPLSPLLITLIAVKQFTSNPSFRKDILFTFDENGILIEGATFKAELVWAHITRFKVIGKFVILYHSKKMGNFIDKTKLTPDQLIFIKSKIEKNPE
jgi:hypothetical protein